MMVKSKPYAIALVDELYKWFLRMRSYRMANHVHRTELNLHLLLLLLSCYYLQSLH